MRTARTWEDSMPSVPNSGPCGPATAGLGRPAACRVGDRLWRVLDAGGGLSARRHPAQHRALGIVAAVAGISADARSIRRKIDAGGLHRPDGRSLQQSVALVAAWALLRPLMESAARALARRQDGRSAPPGGRRAGQPHLLPLRATGRFFYAEYISAVILFIGFLMVAFTDRKRGLHDIIAGTLVVSDRARQAA